MVSAGMAGQSTCNEAGTLEPLQYVFLGVGVVGIGAGIALIVIGAGEGSSSGEHAALNLRLTPSAGPDHAYFGAVLDF
jgi:hypothetical protein